MLCLCASTLMKPDLNVTNAAGSYAYYLRLCGTVRSPPTADCLATDKDTAACQLQLTGTGKRTAYDLGSWDDASPPAWEFINEKQKAKGVQYKMTGAKSWSVSPPIKKYRHHKQSAALTQPAPAHPFLLLCWSRVYSLLSWASGVQQAFSSVVQFVCVRADRPFSIIEPTQTDPCTYVFMIATTLASVTRQAQRSSAGQS